MSGRYDIAQRVKEMLEASDPLKYGDQHAGSIELSPPPQLSPAPDLTALATPLLPTYEPPPTPPVASLPRPVNVAPPPVNAVPPPPVYAAPPPPVKVTPSPPPFAPPAAGPLGASEAAELAALLRDGRKIMAVKRYRELTGVGLAEAKAAVEALEARQGDRDPAPPAPRAAPASPPLTGPPAAAPQVPAWLQPVVSEVRRGNKIGAIKAYRDATGVGLAEAKATVEGLERQLAANAAPPAPAPRPATPDMDLLAEEVVRLVQQGQKIEAIRRYREVTNCGLREAKDAVEAIAARLNSWPR